MKSLPKLSPGWEYLYKVPKGMIVELKDASLVKVITQDGLYTVVEEDLTGGITDLYSLIYVKPIMMANNNNKEKKKNALPKLSRNINKRGTKA